MKANRQLYAMSDYHPLYCMREDLHRVEQLLLEYILQNLDCFSGLFKLVLGSFAFLV